MNKLLLSIFSLVVINTLALAQAPNISYQSPQVYPTGTVIPNLSLVNSGGIIPNTPYAQVSTVAGISGIQGSANGSLGTATFYWPNAMAIDASGNLYVSDNNNVIRKVSLNGTVSAFVGSGTDGFANGQGSAASFSHVNSMVIDASGNIYVSDYGNELIRKITPTGLVSTFAGKKGIAGAENGAGMAASFSGPGGMSIDKDGNIYVAEYNGYLIRKITPAGLVSTLAGKAGVPGNVNGQGTDATFTPSDCAVDKAGNVFVADGNNHVVRKITPSGLVSTFAGSGVEGTADGIGTGASFIQVNTITIDNFDNLYFPDGNGTIRKVTPQAVVTTIAGMPGKFSSANGIGSAARFVTVQDITIDSKNNLFFGDFIDNTIREITTTGLFIDKPLPPGLTFDPRNGVISGVPSTLSPATDYNVTAFNTAGNSTATINITISGNLNFSPITAQVYGVADFSPAISNAGTITYTSSNTAVATVITGKVHVVGAGSTIITATNGSTTIQQTLTVKPAPLNIIANNLSRTVNVNNPPLTVTYSGFVNGDNLASLTTQPTINTTAVTGSVAGSYPIIASGATSPNYTISYTPGTLTVLGGAITTVAPVIKYLNVPTYVNGTLITPLIPINSGGNIPAAAYAQVTTIAGTPGVTGSANGTGAAASFGQPYGLVFDVNGNLYVTEQVNNLIRKITPAGVVTTFAGSGTAGYMDGIGTAAQFAFPSGIAIDVAGNLFVTEQTDGWIRKITPQASVNYYSGGGSSLNGQLTQASFSLPHGLVFDKAGNLYIADTYNLLIRKITPAGVVSTFAGRYHIQGREDGPGTSATFMQPSGIAIDAFGNLYVTDLFSIRKIVPDGTVSTIAGSGLNGNDDGIGTAASFGISEGIALDAPGNVYVMDGISLRKITPDGKVTTLAGIANKAGSVDGIGADARFNFGSGLTISSEGNLYATDYSVIRKISLNGYSIDKPLPPGLNFEPTTGVISGTPTAPSPATIYTITANNISGGSTTTVTIKVASTDASLAGLSINPGSITPVFSLNTLNYSANVTNSVASIGVTPTANGDNSTIKINGIIVNSGTISGDIALAPGSNTVTAAVTAEDGTTTKTYTLNITRAPLTIASLSNLTVSGVTLNPSFTTGTATYSSAVNNSVAGITLTPYTTSATSTVKVNGALIVSGSASGSLHLNVGNNVITVLVTAQDSVTKQSYTLNINRAKAVQTIAFSSLPATTYGSADLALTATSNNSTTPIAYTSSNLLVATILNGKIHITGAGTTSITATQAGDTERTEAIPIAQTLTVNKSQLTVNAIAKTKVYGEPDPALTYTLSSGALIGTDTFTGALSRAVGENAGNYTISQGTLVLGPNYQIIFVQANLVITPKVVSLSAIAKTKVYGEIDPALTYSVFDGSLVGTDAFTGALTRTIGENTGAYVISQGSLALPPNYQINYKSADLTISTKAIAVAADIKTKVYGAADATLTFKIISGGLTGTDAFTGSLARDIGDHVGTYLIKQGTLALNNNYTISFTGNKYMITPKVLNVIANDQTQTYGSPHKPLKASYTGFVTGDDEGSLNVLPTINTSATITSAAGSYDITPSGAVADNYSFNYTKGAFTINKAPLAIKANDFFRVYGKDNPGLTVTYTGFVNGDNSVNLLALPSVSTAADKTTIEGVYDLVPAGAVSDNYSFTYVKGKLTITVPVTNIKVLAISATCKNQNDGSINLVAAQNLNYTATVAGKAYAFTDKLTIGNLTAGAYSVCVTASGLPDYNQCFTVTITEPLDLSLYTVVNKQVNTVSLNLSGSESYTIVLNGKTYQTKNSAITLPLTGKVNKLMVTGDKLCQGVIEREVLGSDNLVPYPNPFQNMVYINLGDIVQANCVVKIVNLTDGKVKVLQKFTSQSGIIQLDVSALSFGVYGLQLTTDHNKELVYKIIKR